MATQSSLLHTWSHLNKTMKRSLLRFLRPGSDAAFQDIHLPSFYRQMAVRGSSVAAALKIKFKAQYDDRLPLVIRGNAALLRLTVAMVLDYVMDWHSSGVGYTTFEVNMVEKDGWDYVDFTAWCTGVRKYEDGTVSRTWFSRTEMERLATDMAGYFSMEDQSGAEPRYAIGIPLIPGDSSTVVEERLETASGLIQAKAGATALVVDDSMISRVLGAHWLARHNIAADVAESGGVALKSLANKHYDLIFMDYAMPGLNGIKTTDIARKRGFLQTSFVIGLDYNGASSVEGATENGEAVFLEAGMHGYLAKPVNPAELNFLLLDLLPRLYGQAETSRLACALDVVDSAREILIDSLSAIPELNAAQGLTNMGQSVEIYSGMLRRFSVELEDYIEPLMTLPLNGAWEEVAARLHVLRNFFAGIGATDLAQQASALAARADAGGGEECLVRIQDYCDAMMRLRAKLIGLRIQKSQAKMGGGRQRVKPEMSPAAETDLATLRQLLSDLHEACLSHRASDAEAAAASLRTMAGDEEMIERIAAICALVDTLDYHEAQERCANLLETITPHDHDTAAP